MTWNIPKPKGNKDWEMHLWSKISPDTKRAKLLAFLTLPTLIFLSLIGE